ncbi:MAG: hypothetical protein HYX67_14985 [Candidatus Melainabacteria bacterium]|nr:hypothetical protein [Candidatus Melainabacteria bacterium]
MYDDVNKLIAKAQSGERLMRVRLRLGTTAPTQVSSLMPAPADRAGAKSDESLFENGMYKACSNVQVADHEWVQFYQLAAKPLLCNERWFQPATTSMTPSVVLVEANFAGDAKDGAVGVTSTLASCAVVGSPPAVPAANALLISFPHGVPPQLHSLAALLNQQSDQSGSWQEASGGAVPGKGHLQMTAASAAGDMPPEMAMQVAFYDWLRSQGPHPAPPQVERLVAGNWSKLPAQAETDALPIKPAEINSCLTKDTGSRTFAFLNQTGPGGSGQPALHSAFAGTDNLAAFPPSALPLRIDAAGRCNLAGRRGFDTFFVQGFLAAVYRTNIASIESATVARALSDRLSTAMQNTKREILITGEELNSVSSRLGRAVAKAGIVVTPEIRSLRRSQGQLTAAVEGLQNKQSEFDAVRKKAQAILMNADYTARVTFDLCANMSSFARQGIFQSDAPKGFLLRDGIIFTPKLEPITEAQIYAAARQKTEHSGDWDSAHFNVMQRTTSNTTIEGHPLKQITALRCAETVPPKFIIFDSRQLTAGPVVPTVLSRSPFADSGITSGQRTYYAADALQSGFDPMVGWSVLIRDLLSARELDGKRTAPSAGKWCSSDQFAATSCPELGVEIQVRSPMAVIPELPVGSSLRARAGGEPVSEIPPTPVGML